MIGGKGMNICENHGCIVVYKDIWGCPVCDMQDEIHELKKENEQLKRMASYD